MLNPSNGFHLPQAFHQMALTLRRLSSHGLKTSHCACFTSTSTHNYIWSVVQRLGLPTAWKPHSSAVNTLLRAWNFQRLNIFSSKNLNDCNNHWNPDEALKSKLRIYMCVCSRVATDMFFPLLSIKSNLSLYHGATSPNHSATSDNIILC